MWPDRCEFQVSLKVAQKQWTDADLFFLWHWHHDHALLSAARWSLTAGGGNGEETKTEDQKVAEETAPEAPAEEK